MPTLNIVEAINLALHQEMKRDKSVVVLGEDVGLEGGVFRVTTGLQKKFGAARVMDTPLAESGIVGTSFGMAVYGLRPVCEIQFDGFVYPAFNQIISHVARIRNRSRGRFTCPMVIRAPICGGIRALEHHSESMEALYAHIPGIKVVIPSTPYDAKGLLISAIRDPDPVIFFEPKRLYRAIKEDVPEKEYTIPIGKAKIVQEGTDITLIAWGAMVRECQRAAEQMKGKASCEVIDVRTISPLDTETLVESVKKTGRCIIVHEAPRSGGWGAEVMARIQEKDILNLKAPIERVTGFDTVMPYYQNENNYLPNATRISKAIDKVMMF
ncbi:MAG TPA: alpha-ketoacid dehydrogenase subunit beta [Candidatus Nanoarchaeia archaeon]|nr:alpha-ketoacid dehydrogenase subunit beta [Candidatus Nanoarchaeia archaeon]